MFTTILRDFCSIIKFYTWKVDDREHSFIGQESQEKRKRKCVKACVRGQIFLDPLENTTQKKLS